MPGSDLSAATSDCTAGQRDKFLLFINLPAVPKSDDLKLSFLAYASESDRPHQSIQNIVIVVLSIGGLGAFVSVILNVLKSLGVVKDGQSATRIIGLNLLGVVALYAA